MRVTEYYYLSTSSSCNWSWMPMLTKFWSQFVWNSESFLFLDAFNPIVQTEQITRSDYSRNRDRERYNCSKLHSFIVCYLPFFEKQVFFWVSPCSRKCHCQSVMLSQKKKCQCHTCKQYCLHVKEERPSNGPQKNKNCVLPTNLTNA